LPRNTLNEHCSSEIGGVIVSNSKANAHLRRFLHSKEGNIAIITAFMMPVLVGFCGLAAETAYWYYRDRDIQGAADVAAYSATIVLRRGGSEDQVEVAATASAAANGWQQANGTIAVNTPPTSGSHQDELSVEVILSENQERYFTQYFFGSTPAIVGARAVGSYHSDGQACFLALNKTKSAAMSFGGATSPVFQDCNAVSNSISATGFQIGGSSNVTIPCVQSAGGFAITATLNLTDCAMPTANAEPTPDPYADAAAPAFNPLTCGATLVSAANTTTNITNTGVRCFLGTNIRGTVNFASGTYVISGPLAANDFAVSGTAHVNCPGGCTFYLTGGSNLNFSGTATFNVRAPTSGPYSGLLFFGDRTQSYGINLVRGTASSGFTGAMYFPSQEVNVTGNFSGSGGCMQLVADTIVYTGSATFSTNCASVGMESIPTPGAVALAE
jgi:hypothetical protein